MDDLDMAILNALSEDANRSTSSLAVKLKTSQPAIWRRIKKLEASGILGGSEVELNIAALGYQVTAFLGIKLALKGRHRPEEFERAVRAIPEIRSVELVLGVYDYRLRVVAKDIADFERILRRRIMSLPGLGSVEANVLLSEERRPGPFISGQKTEN